MLWWPDAAISSFRVFAFSPFNFTRNREIGKSWPEIEKAKTRNRESKNAKTRKREIEKSISFRVFQISLSRFPDFAFSRFCFLDYSISRFRFLDFSISRESERRKRENMKRRNGRIRPPYYFVKIFNDSYVTDTLKLNNSYKYSVIESWYLVVSMQCDKFVRYK